MPLAGNVPDWLFSLVAAVTVFTLMYGIGLALVPGEFRQVWRRRAATRAAQRIDPV